MKKNKSKKPNKPGAAKPETDGWANAITNVGTSRDKREGSVPTVDLMDYGSLGVFYRGSALAGRVVDLPSEDMTREWGDVKIAEDEELAEEMGDDMDRLGVDLSFLQALKWKRAYGGAVIFMAVNDGEKDLSKPINEAKLKSIDALTVFDAFEARPLATEWQDNPVLPGFGLPTKYQLNPHVFASGLVPLQEVHASRFLVFQGPLSNRRQLRMGAPGITQGWGDSILVRPAKKIRDFETSWGGVMHLLADVAQDVIGMADLANMLLADRKNTILKRLQMVNMARSVVNATIVDKDNETFERKGTPLAGVADILREAMDSVSAEVGIPTVVLFGVSPGGMNATGENDMQIWYDAVAAMQRREIKPQIRQLTRLMMLAKEGPAAGKVPESWSFKFRPLWQQTDTEKAAIRFQNAQTDKIYHDLGVASTEDIATSRWCGDEYGMDLTIDMSALEEREAQSQEMADATHEATITGLENPEPAAPAKPGQKAAPAPGKKPPTTDRKVTRDGNIVFKIKDRVIVKATKKLGTVTAIVDKVAVLFDEGANTVNAIVQWFDAADLDFAPSDKP